MPYTRTDVPFAAGSATSSNALNLAQRLGRPTHNAAAASRCVPPYDPCAFSHRYTFSPCSWTNRWASSAAVPPVQPSMFESVSR